ncbi:MAG: EF2563 family selenium-dependent molybdenum hydroxylase system protein [bacterium]|nr:MAG: EF2563 family selenium-dependent molybdenum hydroxylase system protein [bacterium]
MKRNEARIAPRVLVRGAGDFATGIIHRLHNSGFVIVATEIEKPLAVRRGVALSEAVYERTYTVEGVTAVLAAPDETGRVLEEGKVPLVIDPDADILERGFDIVVDARSAKRNLGTTIDDAPIVIAIGPGFEAGTDCHAVVETLPGEGVGRVIYEGSAADDTGYPGHLKRSLPCTCACNFDDAADLLLRAPAAGNFLVAKDIGSVVEKGDTAGWILAEGQAKRAVKSHAKGMVRGIIRDGTPVDKGMKLGDIDPVMERDRCYTIAEKSRAVAGGVLEACMTLFSGRGMIGSRPAGSD